MIAERILTKFLTSVVKKNLVLEKNTSIEYPQPKTDRPYMLYAHVPFCESLCPYCSFNRFIFNREAATAYHEQLRTEMHMVASMGYRFESMYIGGGTPTILIDELIKTIDLARELFDLKEVSCETNPNHLTDDVVGRLQGRVQRLSVGVQSFDNELLKQMKRFEKYGSGEVIVERIRRFSKMFPTLNVDMIFNFPGQTPKILQRDIEMLISSEANQVSFYPLMTAPAVRNSISSSVGQVDYTREVDFYRIITDGLQNDFRATSAWTFSRSNGGMIDEYIVDYEEYVGIGSGSFSYLNGGLYVNTFSLNEYAEKINAGELSTTAMRHFSKHDRMRYRFMMELFGLELNTNKFSQEFDTSIEKGLWLEMAFMKAAGGFQNNSNGKLHLTPTGQYLLLVMMREFFCGVDDVREQARHALSSEEQVRLLGCAAQEC